MAPSGAEARVGEGGDVGYVGPLRQLAWLPLVESRPGLPGPLRIQDGEPEPMSHDPSEGARLVFALTAHGLGRLMWSGQIAKATAGLEASVPKAAIWLAVFLPRRWSSAPEEAVGRSRSRAELPERPIGWSSGTLSAFGGA